MSKNLEFLKPVLGDELYPAFVEKVTAAEGIALTNIADGSYIPKAKFDEERTRSSTYKQQIDDLNAKLTTFQEAAGISDTLKKQIEQLKSDIAAKDTAMKQQQMEYSIREAVRNSKAKNVDVVFRMIDTSKITDSNGELFGIAEQLEALKKSDSYLFEGAAEPNGGIDPHREPGGNASGNASVNDMIRRAAGR